MATGEPTEGAPPRVDPVACSACGVCAVACPTGAVRDVGAKQAELVEAASTAAGRLVVQCVQAAASRPAPDAAGVGCLAAWHPEGLALVALRLGAGALVLEHVACEACPVAPVDCVAQTVRLGARLAASVAPAVAVEETIVPPAAAGRRPPTLTRQVSREALLRPRAEPTGSASTVAAPRWQARAELLALAPEVPLPGISITQACVGCGACAEVCPSRALRGTAGGGVVQLNFDARACSGCGECVRVCQEDAVALLPRKRGPHERRLLHTVVRARCGRCEAQLAPGEQGLCTRCSSRQDLLADVWAQVGGVHDSR